MRVFSTLFTLLSIFFSFAHSDCTPDQIHLSLSDSYTLYPGRDSPMRAIFHTKEPCDSAYITLTTPAGIQKLTATSNYCYKRNFTQGFFISYVHTFDFPPLEYSKSYEYSCYGGDSGDKTLPKQVGPFKFYLPNPKYEGQETNVVLFADMDDTEFGMPTINRLTKIAQTNFSKIDAFFHIGDMAYNLPRNAGRRGDEYMRAIQPFTAIMPYMVTPGNHENFSNFSNFNMRFKMPLYKQTQNHYYSFGIGNIHFVTFNLDLVMMFPELRQPMLDWLKQDLDRANKNRKEKPWVVALTHRPLYCSFQGSDDCLYNQQRFADFEDLLAEERVDLFVAGHVHIYERMFPIRRGKVTPFEHSIYDIKFRRFMNPQSPIHIVQGMAGHRGDAGDPQDAYKGKDFTVKVSKEYSYLAVRSSNSTHLKVENYESVTGTINDYFYIIRTQPPLQIMLPRPQKPSFPNDRHSHF